MRNTVYEESISGVNDRPRDIGHALDNQDSIPKKKKNSEKNPASVFFKKKIYKNFISHSFYFIRLVLSSLVKGERLIQFCKKNQLVATNTCFQ